MPKRDKFIILITALTMVLCILAYSSDSYAEDIRLETSGGWTVNAGEEETYGIDYRATFGLDSFPIYGVLGYDKDKVRLLGQPVGKTKTLMYGLGVEQRWGKFVVFGEAGYSSLKLNTNDEIVEEMAYTVLVNNHHNVGRPIPIKSPLPANGFRPNHHYLADYNLSDAPVMRFGVSYYPIPYVVVTFSYKYFKPEEYLSIKDKDWKEGQGYWEETRTNNFSGFETFIGVRF